jgi:lipopolysaccharide export LptBFGC system permease protein LptF
VYRFALFFSFLISVSTFAPAQEKKRFMLYAALREGTPVQLTDGSKWHMDKGDTFPVVMFKDQQTKVVLQLAGTSFMIKADQIEVVEEKDLTPAQMATYRNNVNNYLEARAEKWKAEQAK